MKNRIIAESGLFCIVLFLIVSCSKNEDEYCAVQDANKAFGSSIKQETLQKDMSVIFPYLIVDANRYMLRLSQKQAEQIGVSKEDYNGLLKNITEANAFYEKYIKDKSNIKTRQLSGSERSKMTYDLTPLSLEDSLDSGVSELDSIDGGGKIADGHPVYFSLDVPGNVQAIDFNIYSPTLIGWGQVVMSNGYGVVSNTSFSVLGYGGGCRVSPPVSGTTYRVSIQVSNSEGGSYWYEFIEDTTSVGKK